MNDANVQKHVGNQAPPLTGHREAAPVCSPTDQHLPSRAGDGNPIQNHRNENSEIDAYENLGKTDSAGISRSPGSGHNRLNSVCRLLAALHRFMAHTPFADSPPEDERRHLASAFSTIGHVA